MKTNEIGIELKDLGLEDQSVYRNLTVGELVDDIVANNEGIIGLRGAAMVDTGIYTGRSPKDKYIVDEPSSNSDIWWGPVNQKISEETFNELYDQVTNFYNLNSQSKTYVFDGFAVDPKHTLSIRIIAKKLGKHILFTTCLFVQKETNLKIFPRIYYYKCIRC